jgi:hypothetical protein
MLALGGGALGVALAAAAVKTVARAAVDYVPHADHIGIDGRVLTFAVLLSGLTGLVFALSPAPLASRADVHRICAERVGLTGGGVFCVRVRCRAVRGRRRARNRRRTAAAAQFLEHPSRAAGVRRRPRDGRHRRSAAQVHNGAAIAQFYGDLLGRLGGRGDSRAAGIVNNLPVSGSSWTAWLTIENMVRPDDVPPDVGHRAASPGYFAALRIPVLDGRGLADSDTPESPKIAVVNHALASRFFPRGGAVGTRIRIGRNPNAPWRTVVGVVGRRPPHRPGTRARTGSVHAADAGRRP